MMATSHYVILLFLISSLNCDEGNMANVFAIRDEYYRIKKYVALILFSLALLYNTVGNVLMAIVFYCGQDSFYSHSFVLISSQLIICNFLNFIPQVTIVLFEMLKTEINDAYMSTWAHSIFATIDTFSFLATLHFTFFLAVNRLVVLSLPKFSFLIACVWLSVLVISLTEFHYCIKTFNVSNLKWSFNCTKTTFESGAIFLKIRYIWTLALPIAMFSLYIPIFCKMRRKRYIFDLKRRSDNIGTKLKSTTNNGKYERSMLIQAAVVCGAMEIEIICFYFLPQFAAKLAGKEAGIPVNIFINCYVIFNGAVLPTVNLIFFKRFRNEVKRTIIELLSKINM
uniref:G-protein coupled receptors family 1 profile domain-containing protein n=1 Tax=Onchocerca volvulus TaxID=6282 RepID=A0A8R1TMF3_ONCVO